MGRRNLILLLCVSISMWFTFAPGSTKSNPEPIRRVTPQAATLIINEYLADPATGAAGDANGDGTSNATQDEFVELVNTGAVALNISGFTISDATSVRFTFPPGTSVPAGEATVVFGGGTPTGAFGNAGANGLVFAAGGVGLSLNNGGDTITVRDSLAANVDTLTFGASEGGADQSITRSPDITGVFTRHSLATGSGGTLFSPGARVNGRPFVTNDPLINSISPDFVIAGSGTVMVTVTGDKFQNGAQVRINGTPIATGFTSVNQLDAQVPPSVTGAPNVYSLDVQNPDTVVSNEVAFRVFAQVGINEFLADPPAGAAGDANGDGTTSTSQDEFIEVVNRTAMPLQIGGFSISDNDSVRFTFPPGTTLPANEAAVVFGGGSPTGDFGNAAINGLIFTATLSLNNAGDTITLKDNGGGVIEQIIYGSSEGGADQSINRNPEVVGVNFSPHSTITPGSLFSPGTTTDGSPFTPGPRISEIDPDRVPLDSPPFDLTVRGSGFEIDSIVLIDNITFPAQLIAGDLIVNVPASITSVAVPHTVEVRNAGGNRSNTVTLVIIPPPPLLSLVLPRQVVAGGPSFTMFLVGANFEPASVVLIDDSTITPQFLSVRELRITVPAALIATTGSRSVRVRNGDGLISNALIFDVVLPSARITRISPGQAIVGSPAFTLTVTGVNFRNGSTVSFDQTLLVTRFVSATELQAEVPASLISTPGLKSVTVQNDDGLPSNDAVFSVLPDAPLISSIQPRSVIEGSGDTTLAITGVKFQRGGVARLIENSLSGARLQTTFISAERIEAMLPAAFVRVPGKVFLIVENPDFGISNTVALDVLIKDPLVINEYLADPPDSAVGDANGDGTRSSSQDEFIEIVNRTSAPIDISGYRLFDSEAVRHVFANGTIIPAKEAAVVFGGGSPSGRFGNAAENRLVFEASTGGLSLANTGDSIRLEDNHGQVIQEIHFGAAEGGASQAINRSPDIDGAVFARHTIVAGVPNRLFSPGAKASGETFTIKPSISALMPSSARVGSSAFTLKVTGENFLPDAVVLFGQTELATVHRSASELEAGVTAGMIAEGGAIDVRVRNPQGETSTSARFLVTDDPPVIEAITPASTGTGAENFEITITGRRFQRGAQAMIENETVETQFISSGQIKARVPDRFFSRAADIGIRVKNADGNQSNAASLTVENGPLITRLSRKKIKAGRGEMEITIGGVAFKSGVRLLVNGVEVPTIFISETEFSSRIPGAMTAAPVNLTIQALNPDGGRSNRATIRVVD